MRILVVEDDQEIQYTVSLAFDLYWQGATVLAAFDGSQAIQMMENEIPDILIVDLGLPDIDGLKLCHLIQDRFVVPIVILTASDRPEDVAAGLKAGAADFVTKPFSPKELITRVWAVARRCKLPTWSEDFLAAQFAD